MNKILFILRCYSGFEESIIKNNRSPHGATTIAKFLVYIQKRQTCSILLVSKSNNYELNKINDKKIYLKNLNIPIYFIRTKLKYFTNTKIGKLYKELYNNISIIYYVFKLKPKIIYTDHANIHIAAFICRFFKIKTVVRLMGIKEDMLNCLNGNSLLNRLLKWSYYTPFSMVIATQDGTGAETWMNRALLKSVPRKTVLNGVDRISNSFKPKLILKLPKNKVTIIFVGRLEYDKAPDKFIESFIKIEKTYPNKFHAIVIGSGSMKTQLLNRISEEKIDKRVTFFSNLSTLEIFDLLRFSNIYVSLNRNGNLSNSNIEAMVAGKAMIIPSSDNQTGKDVYTDTIIDNEAVLRVNNSDNIEEIAQAIIFLYKNKKIRKKLEKNIIRVTNKYLKSWNDRISWEYKLISLILKGSKTELNNFLKKDKL